MLKNIGNCWHVIRLNLRQLSGEDAYERYLISFAEHQKLHGVESGYSEHHKPLNRQAFFKQWQDEKWTGIKRCC